MSFLSNIEGEVESIFGTKPVPVVATLATTVSTTTADTLKAFASSESAKIITALKTQTDIGQAVAADVATAESTTLTGAEKFAQVVTNTVPLVLKYVTGGGIAAVESDVLGIAQALVQDVFNDTASTSFGKLAAPLLKLLGL